MIIQYQPDLFDDEWDKIAHTPDEYRREIRQLRERCATYAKELEGLRADLEAAEREACAKLADEFYREGMEYDIGAAIRARKQKVPE